jgi:hypothetical protein
MKKFILGCPALPLTLNTWAQDDYIISDSSAQHGIEFVKDSDLLNSVVCRLNDDRYIMKFTPQDMSEYGYINGKVYVSGGIRRGHSLHRVFLE